MRERTPSSAWSFIIAVLAILLAAKFVYTTLFTRFAY
jgi:hypothetical protein